MCWRTSHHHTTMTKDAPKQMYRNIYKTVLLQIILAEEMMEAQQLERGSTDSAVTRSVSSLTLSLHEAPLLHTDQCRRQGSRGAERREIQSTASGNI